MFDQVALKAQFPILSLSEKGHPLVYLDNASTSQKPLKVIEAVNHYYREQNANVHRGVYGLSERGTEAFEAVREQVRNLLNARSYKEVIFVRGATEAINLVAQSWGRANLVAGDEVIVSEMEHHSNLVPWQMLRDQLDIKVVKWPINQQGELSVDELAKLINSRTKLIAVTQMSNALGTINPIEQIVKLARKTDIKVLVDGAQSISHMAVDVQALDCDFFVFSGHKMYGPTGIGGLVAKQDLLEVMPPYQGGGDMIYSVTFDKTEYNELPYKFEAGTPNIAGVIGLGAAIEFIQDLGFKQIADIENDLLQYATQRLTEIDSLRIIGTAKNKGAVVSFVIDGAHPHDLATLLDQDGVAVRASHHCAMPVMQKFDVPATVRASFGVYNTHDDVDRLVDSVNEALDMLR